MTSLLDFLSLTSYLIYKIFLKNYKLIISSSLIILFLIVIFFIIDYNYYKKTNKSLWHKIIK